MTIEDELQVLRGAGTGAPQGRPDATVVGEFPLSGADPARPLRLLETVLEYSRDRWPELDGWRRILPEWFVAACAPEQTAEEAARWLAWWRGLPPEEQARAEREQAWSLPDWLYWLHPDQRRWRLVGARAEPARTTIEVTLTDPMAPVGELEWLLRASGATTVDARL